MSINHETHPTPAMSLDRFVQAQEASYEVALAELKAGRKTGHWIHPHAHDHKTQTR
jgi:uncharacterized protein (DUF1810 family)